MNNIQSISSEVNNLNSTLHQSSCLSSFPALVLGAAGGRAVTLEQARPTSGCKSSGVSSSLPSYTSLPQTWAAFLNKPEWNWQWYGHFTFRDRSADASGLRRFVHPEAALKIWDGFIHQVNREIFGNRYYKRKKDGVVWARATEFQVRGAIHYHAIIGRVPDTVRRMDYVDHWYSKAGLARIYKYEKGKGAEGYLSKSCYAWKRGEIDLGGPLAVCLKESDTAVLLG